MTADPLTGPPVAEAPSRTFRSVAAPLVLLRIAGQGLEFVGFVLLARRLGASTFGLLAVPFLIARYLGIAADWGASLRGPRDVAAASPPAAIRALTHRRTQTSVALTAIFAGIAIATGHANIAPMAVTILGRGMSRDWLALGREKGMRAGLPSATQGFLIAAGAAFADSLLSASIALAIGYGVAAALSIHLNRLPHADHAGPAALPIDGWLLLATMAVQVYITSDTILLSLLATDADAGIYAAIYRLPNAWMTVFGLVALSILPGMTRRVREDPKLVLYLKARALRLGTFAGAAVLITIPLAYLFVPVLFGESYRAGQVPIVILMMTVSMFVFTVALDPLYLAIGSDRSYALCAVVMAVFNVSANLVAIPRWQMTGAATVTLGSQVILSTFLLVMTHREGHRMTLAAAGTASPDDRADEA